MLGLNTSMSLTLSPHQLVHALNWRYATKKFDPAKPISAETWHALEQSLILAPSSIGLQPWRFVVVTDPAVKAQLSLAPVAGPTGLTGGALALSGTF